MGHTNSTANLALPQFIGTDKPTWLSDVNGAFSAIDTYAGNNDAALAITDAKADTAVNDAASAVTTATNAANTAGTASTQATNAVTVAGNALTVANGINSKVGVLTDLHTTDKSTVVNAINEVFDAQAAPTAADVSYNNTGSGLTATDVQAAIDEVVTLIPGSGTTVTLTADGVKNNGQLLDDLYALVNIASITGNASVTFAEPNGSVVCYSYAGKKSDDTLKFGSIWYDSNFIAQSIFVKASGSVMYYSSAFGAATAATSTVPPTGTVITLQY